MAAMKELAWFALLVVLPLGCAEKTDGSKTRKTGKSLEQLTNKRTESPTEKEIDSKIRQISRILDQEKRGNFTRLKPLRFEFTVSTRIGVKFVFSWIPLGLNVMAMNVIAIPFVETVSE